MDNELLKEVKKISSSLSDLIQKAEAQKETLHEEQDNYEYELENWDTGDEDAVEPFDPGNGKEIGELESLIGNLRDARDILDNI